MIRYFVAYAKFVDDKKIGIIMTGIFYGGVAKTPEEADGIATRCVSDVQGGIIIPKIIEIKETDFLGAVQEINDRFNKMAEQMYENEKTIKRSN